MECKNVLVRKNPLFFAFLFPAVTDGVLTFLGQDFHRGVINEASPVYYILLISPWLFILGSIFWFVFWYKIFKRLKEPVNLFLMFLFITAHSWGSSSWIWKIAKDNGLYLKEDQFSVIVVWGFMCLYMVLIGLFATYNLQTYIRNKK